MPPGSTPTKVTTPPLELSRRTISGQTLCVNTRLGRTRERRVATDHFLAIYGYEMDSTGRVTALLAKDNAVSGTAEVRFDVRADGSIVKPKEPGRAEGEKYLRQEYQMSEVRFHDSLKYTGTIQPTNDAGKSMVWQPKP